MASSRVEPGPERRPDRSAAAEAGVRAGLAGLAVFLVLHHLWILPIWFILPVGAVMAGAGGAVVGVAYAELLPHLPREPWTSMAVGLGIAAILAPSVVLAEVGGPVYTMGANGDGTLVVPASQALAAFVVGLLGSATIAGAVLGWLVGRTARAAIWTALAGLTLALGPGHNIPLLGATPAVGKELAILAAVTAAASLVLVRCTRPATAHAPREARGIRPPPEDLRGR